MNEIWKDIDGYEGLYQVSNLGRVRSLNYNRSGKGRIMKSTVDHYGYYVVNLYKNAKPRLFKVHRLVANAFLENPNNKSEVDHINTIKTDNNVNNLRWVTSNENMNNNLTLSHLKDSLKEYSSSDDVRKRLSEQTKNAWKNKKYREHWISKKLGNKCHNKPIVQCNMSGEIIKCWPSARVASKKLNIGFKQISSCCNLKRNSAHGFKFYFLYDVVYFC